jgi:DNA-binding GntR family transcriptional regulator
VVTRPTAGQIFELFDVREVLEALCVRLATERAPRGSWDALAERFGPAAEAAIARGELEVYVDALGDLRRATIEAAGSALLAGLLDSLHDRTRVLVRRLVILPGRAAQGLRDHRGILEAMQRGEGRLAEERKRNNIHGARECFERYQKFLI